MSPESPRIEVSMYADTLADLERLCATARGQGMGDDAPVIHRPGTLIVASSADDLFVARVQAATRQLQDMAGEQ